MSGPWQKPPLRRVGAVSKGAGGFAMWTAFVTLLFLSCILGFIAWIIDSVRTIASIL